jgi:hypothetical protein
MANSLSMYSITENIYYSQLSSVGLLLQPEPLSHRIVQGKDWVLSPHALSPCGLPLPPTCLLVTVNEARCYFASAIHGARCSSRSVDVTDRRFVPARSARVVSPVSVRCF